MIHDLALRWLVTLLFVFSAAVCVRGIATDRHSAAGVVSHSLHALMAVAMAVMAWPRGAELPTRAPMLFFAAAAVWFLVVMVRSGEHRWANAYHTFMMLAMAWMYAAMGGLPLRQPATPTPAMPAMPEMPGMPGDSPAGHHHTGQGSHSGHGSHATETAAWVGGLNWLCTVVFGAAAVFWLYRFVRADGGRGRDLGVLCQFAMATGMAIMFGVML